MPVTRSIEAINQKITQGQAVVLTAEEVTRLAREQGVRAVAEQVDVVTTATFAPMCSSGAFLNFGHARPPIKMGKVWLNEVPAYAGLAAVDAYIGATELCENGNGEYGGAHVIEELIDGKDIKLKASGKGTDCYPRKDIETLINKDSINEAFLFNPRNAYQNYTAATNSTDKTLYTYMGILLPNFGNITYSTSGELSPLLNDPELRTIGIGTKIFLGGAQGWVAWNGTQFNSSAPLDANRIPLKPAATLSLIGDLKAMSTEFIKAAVFEKYGVSLFVGIGIPVPILDYDIAQSVALSDAEIKTTLVDFGQGDHPALATLSYQELKSGEVKLEGKTIRTGPLSSMYKARQIAGTLKDWISRGSFLLTPPLQALPRNSVIKSLQLREA